MYIRAVVSGGAVGVLLTLFQPEGADYAHHITGSTPGFGNLTTALYCKHEVNHFYVCSFIFMDSLKTALKKCVEIILSMSGEVIVIYFRV